MKPGYKSFAYVNKANPGDVKWMRTVAQSGTLSDKIAAANVMLTSSPVHQLKPLKMLVDMAASKGKREAVMAAEALLELFKGRLLPPNRKLKYVRLFFPYISLFFLNM